PAGTQTLLGDRPFGVALSPDGTYLAVTNDGASTQSIMTVNRATSTVVSEVDYSGPQGVYVGIAYSPDGSKLYASAGGTVFTVNGASYNGVRVYNVDPATGNLTATAPILIPMPVGANGKALNLFTAGLTLSADGNTLYVADNLGGSLSVVDLASSQATTGGAATTFPVGAFPYTLLLSHDGQTAYVSHQGGQTVSLIHLTHPALLPHPRRHAPHPDGPPPGERRALRPQRRQRHDLGGRHPLERGRADHRPLAVPRLEAGEQSRRPGGVAGRHNPLRRERGEQRRGGHRPGFRPPRGQGPGPGPHGGIHTRPHTLHQRPHPAPPTQHTP